MVIRIFTNKGLIFLLGLSVNLKVVDSYLYEERIPLKDDVPKTLKVKPK